MKLDNKIMERFTFMHSCHSLHFRSTGTLPGDVFLEGICCFRLSIGPEGSAQLLHFDKNHYNDEVWTRVRLSTLTGTHEIQHIIETKKKRKGSKKRKRNHNNNSSIDNEVITNIQDDIILYIQFGSHIYYFNLASIISISTIDVLNNINHDNIMYAAVCELGQEVYCNILQLDRQTQMIIFSNNDCHNVIKRIAQVQKKSKEARLSGLQRSSSESSSSDADLKGVYNLIDNKMKLYNNIYTSASSAMVYASSSSSIGSDDHQHITRMSTLLSSSMLYSSQSMFVPVWVKNFKRMEGNGNNNENDNENNEEIEIKKILQQEYKKRYAHYKVISSKDTLTQQDIIDIYNTQKKLSNIKMKQLHVACLSK